ncbi:MAG: hypothetical protein HY343_03895, partial [Lentisphaerae bacterium]|nr:hypothetical protein [Lentisphaerota bacterium]
MRILLLTVSSETAFNTEMQVCIPFGLAGIGSYVQPDGHEFLAIDMNAASQRDAPRYLAVDPALLERIAGFAPELVAMSTYSANMHNVLFWALTIK